MGEAVYILCFLTSAAVALLLLRAYARARKRILLWSGVGFIFICLNNLFLIVDLMLIQGIDFSLPRHLLALAGGSLLLFGLIWDSD